MKWTFFIAAILMHYNAQH